MIDFTSNSWQEIVDTVQDVKFCDQTDITQLLLLLKIRLVYKSDASRCKSQTSLSSACYEWD